ncbi:hypothetical protein NEMBOFW57_007842 [Staphylotrichum longicolle]|uniref:Cytochrome P450 n=1 Tax=Staphylotrichum longicolle TaxID=669026 RepID=A0AAD4EV71_9PEZI|nr:hypothetical protein NEMBOFW57_007842 [Staphylotrichum longicolle]
MFFTAVLTLIFIFVILHIYFPWRAKQAEKERIASEAARRGCLPAPTMSKNGFLGFGRLIEGLRATREGRGPHYVIEAIDSEMGKDVDTVLVPIFDYNLVVSRDPDVIRHVLSNTLTDWDISEHRSESWNPLVGHGIFTARGEHWKHSRALVRPQFALDQINDLFMFERHVEQLFVAIDRHRDTGARWTQSFDLQPYLYNLTLDIVTEMLFGYSVHSQNPSERVELPEIPGFKTPDRANIGKHMDAGKAWIETRGALWKYRWLLPCGEFYKHCTAIHEYAQWFVQLRLLRGDKYLDGLQQHDSDTSNSERYCLLNELAKLTQDPTELRSQPLNVLTAGRDTTAALIGWMFYFLARHPRIFRKLRREVLNVFGPFLPSCPTGISFRPLRDNMPYMTAVINETLRVAPVVPLNERVALRDTVLPTGGGPNRDHPVFVPKGTQILIPTYALGMRPQSWGPDYARFRPERWTNGPRDVGFAYIPFGGGSRQCLGQQLTRIKAAYVTVRLLQRFDRVLNAEEPRNAPMKFHHTIENRSESGVQVRLRAAPWSI